MARLNPEKLSVKFRDGVTETDPIIPRCYTLTHSDITAQLFLIIGQKFAYDKVNQMRDEVLAKWVKPNNQYFLNVYLYIDGGEFAPGVIFMRNTVFRRELPLALEAIVYGDRKFFNEHKELKNAQIIVYFKSSIPYLNRVENWGTPLKYEHKDKEKTRELVKLPMIQDKVIVTLLNPYISKEVFKLYRRRASFCLKDVEILSIKEIETADKCKSNYEVTVGLKVGKNPPPYNNFIIEFIITSNSIKTKSVKNPR